MFVGLGIGINEWVVVVSERSICLIFWRGDMEGGEVVVGVFYRFGSVKMVLDLEK